MNTPIQSQTLASPHLVVGTFLVLAAASAVLWGDAEQSERGKWMLNWLDKHIGTGPPPAESDLYRA
uniref:hypothetical protein n=1 Tax=Streptomyces chartreusis TaxID=1969 RepID=UPI003F492DC1